MTTPTDDVLVEELAARLEPLADERTRQWWERYMKGAARFRGVKMAATRGVVGELVTAHDIDVGDPTTALTLAHAWFRRPHSEDQLAAVLLLGEHSLDVLTIDDVEALAAPLADGSIGDWNVCDWYCVKVVGPFITCGEDVADRARAVAAWSDSEQLWLRRAGAVAFVDHAATSPELFDGFTDLLIEVCEHNVDDGRRWSQTSVGWLLRELSRREPDLVERFVDGHPELNTEARKNALKYSDATLPR